MTRRAAFISVVPSPYQRDLFHALAQRTEVDLHVFYLEAASPDSPWPEKPLASYEKILPGFWFPIGSARCHLNWPLPDLRAFDVVVLNSLMSLTAQWLMRFKLRRKPWLFWGERLQGSSRLHRLLTAPLHRAAGIAGIGSLAERDYSRRFPEPKHFRIPYYCDLDPFIAAPRPQRNEDGLVFLFCGQMIARKGVDVLLEAFKRLVEKHPTSKLLLVGREADLPALLNDLPAAVRARVSYAGFQPPEELPRFFAQADVFILPSRYDGWGVVVNQALGAGLPLLCSDKAGAAHDLIEEEVNGLKFAAEDASALEQAMERLAGQPSLAAKWGAESKRKAQEWLPERGAAKWLEAFEAVLSK